MKMYAVLLFVGLSLISCSNLPQKSYRQVASTTQWETVAQVKYNLNASPKEISYSTIKDITKEMLSECDIRLFTYLKNQNPETIIFYPSSTLIGENEGYKLIFFTTSYREKAETLKVKIQKNELIKLDEQYSDFGLNRNADLQVRCPSL